MQCKTSEELLCAVTNNTLMANWKTRNLFLVILHFWTCRKNTLNILWWRRNGNSLLCVSLCAVSILLGEAKYVTIFSHLFWWKAKNYSSKTSFKVNFYYLKITSSNQYSWHAVHYCNCDGQLTVTLQQTIISGSYFNPDALLRPLTWRYSELNCN